MEATKRRVDERALESLARRDFIKKGAILGGAAGLVGLLGGYGLRDAQGAPGAGAGGTTITDTDIDARRISGVRIASEFASSGSGTTADPWPGQAIQDAIDDLPSTGGVVLIPNGTFEVAAGTYIIIPVATHQIAIVGQGWSSIIKRGANHDQTMIRSERQNLGDSYESGTPRNENFVMMDLKIDGNRGNNTPDAGVVRNDVYLHLINGLIKNCYFVDGLHNNLTIRLSNRVTVKGCTFDSSYDGQFYFRDSTDCIISNCHFLGTIEQDQAIRNRGSGNIISYNTIELQDANVTGINILTDPGVQIIGNQIYGTHDFGIVINASDCMVKGNFINGSGDRGIYLTGTVLRTLIEGNYIIDCFKGIEIVENSDEVTVIGNFIRGSLTRGIWVNGGDDIQIIGNRIWNSSINNPNSNSGIEFAGSSDGVLIVGNRCFDNQGTKTQRHGIALVSGVTNAMIAYNDLRGNLTSAFSGNRGTGSIIRNNLGDAASNRGTAIILNGTASIAVAHGLASTPIIVAPGPKHAEVSAVIWSADATNITFTVPSNVTADRDLSWYAEN